jgi:hypothetical protein
LRPRPKGRPVPCGRGIELMNKSRTRRPVSNDKLNKGVQDMLILDNYKNHPPDIAESGVEKEVGKELYFFLLPSI